MLGMQLTFDWAGLPMPKQSSDFFFLSDQWIKLRYKTLTERGNYCECCGRGWTIGNPIQVDHIKPRSRFPHLALDPNNLQVICRECNMGKGAWDTTDWRRPNPAREVHGPP